MIRLPAVAHSHALRRIALASLLCTLAQTWGCALQGQGPQADASPVALDARPNGLAVRPDDGAIYLTDDATSSVLRSTDGHAFSRYAEVPTAAGQAASLSQIAFDAEGNLLVERFGFGTAGGLFSIAGADHVVALAGLDPTRRRLGLASAGAHRALSTWFKGGGEGSATGGLSLVTYDAATGEARERDLVTGLGKPVGVVVLGDKVFVADQARNVIVSASLPTLLAAAQPVAGMDTYARIAHPDLMAADPATGALYTRCNAESVCRIAADGTVSEIASGFHDARGVALNPSRHVLYVVDRAASGGTSSLRSVALP
jgi:DNA-binding beta-propeller fold protein YncE